MKEEELEGRKNPGKCRAIRRQLNGSGNNHHSLSNPQRVDSFVVLFYNVTFITSVKFLHVSWDALPFFFLVLALLQFYGGIFKNLEFSLVDGGGNA